MPGTNLLSLWPKEGPRVLWRKDVGQGFSGPVSASNRVVLFHRVADAERVECFEAASGQQLWSFDYPTAYRDDFGFDEGPRAIPTISGNRVYTYGAEGILHSVDFATGQKLWSVDCKTEFGARKGFFGIAVLAPGRGGTSLAGHWRHEGRHRGLRPRDGQSQVENCRQRDQLLVAGDGNNQG
jgi:outer membrane protein assembly factor BamB